MVDLYYLGLFKSTMSEQPTLVLTIGGMVLRLVQYLEDEVGGPIV
jgi:hypothetical protein